MEKNRKILVETETPHENGAEAPSGLLSRGERFLELFHEGRDFMLELLEQNKRLSHRLALLEKETATRSTEARDPELQKELEQLRIEKAMVELDNRDFAQRYLAIEDQNNNLANLYVASYQLHSSLEMEEVIRSIFEIITNLVAAEQFALMLLDDDAQNLVLVAQEGFDSSEQETIPVGEGIIGKVAATGESYFSESDEASRDFDSPLACIPLLLKNRVIGVIAIHQLMIQKQSFTPVDHELFDFLAGQAGVAIISAKLFAKSTHLRDTQ